MASRSGTLWRRDSGGRRRSWLTLLPLLALGGCSSAGWRLFHPAGPVAAAAWRFTVIDVLVMLVIILPVTLMICLFAHRYRKSRNGTYDADWSHSMTIEVIIWGLPLIVVAVLGYFTYESVIQVNPYAPTALDAPKAPAGTMQAQVQAPLQVEAVAMDWQWLFIYPDQNIASLNELVVPAGRNVALRMTSTSVTNDFYIPQLAPMIDVMPGMQTKDAFRADAPGTFMGFAANYSGVGFSWMQFATKVVTVGDFATWVGNVKAGQGQPSSGALTHAVFQTMAKPTINLEGKTARYSSVEPMLFDRVMQDAMDGVVYPVPGDLTEHMTPTGGTAGKPSGS